MKKFLFGLCMLSLQLTAQQYPGYTLYSAQNSTSATLLDTNGNVYKTWSGFTKQTGYSTYMMPGGVLLRTAKATGVSFSGGPICGAIQKISWSGAVIWDFAYSTANYVSHHDICPMPNGNVLLIAYERKTAAEVAAAGCTAFNSEMWPDKIVEIQPTGATTGTVVWEWHAWDHLMQNTNASAANYQSSLSAHPELLNVNYLSQKDWLHMNGLDYNDSLDQIAFTSHNLNEVYIIDHSTTTAQAASHTGGNSGKGGDILYRWGNPAAFGAIGTKVFNVVHDAHWIPKGCPNAGRLVCLNNGGQTSPSQKSTVDQIILPYNGYNYSVTSGSAYLPSTYTSRLVASAYTSNQGNSNQLPNGNTLVCIAMSGLIYETNPVGATIWSKTITSILVQAHRYSECFINGAPATPTISQIGDTLKASLAAAYQWYSSGIPIPGANAQNFIPTQSGFYQVTVANGNGCESDTSIAFNFFPFGIKNAASSFLPIIYPNPTEAFFNINLANNEKLDFDVQLFDAQGKLILSLKNSNKIDVSGFENGVYNLLLTDKFGNRFSKKLVIAK